jgi:hypothetical protein
MPRKSCGGARGTHRSAESIEGRTGVISPVPGQGRSFNAGVIVRFQRRYQVADAKVVGYLIASEVRITWLLRCRLKLGPKEQTSLKFRFGSEAVVGVPKTASALPSKADFSSDVDADLAERQANVGFWD